MNADGCYLRLSATKIISFSIFGKLCTFVHIFELWGNWSRSRSDRIKYFVQIQRACSFAKRKSPENGFFNR